MIPITYTVNSKLYVKLEGELDANVASLLKDDFQIFSKLNTSIVLDLSEVQSIDSSMVGEIVFLYKRLLIQGYDLSIIRTKDQSAELLDILKLALLAPCFNDINVNPKKEYETIEIKKAS